jgi:hypothetical protein
MPRRLNIGNSKIKKQRGQKRKLKSLLQEIDEFAPSECVPDKYCEFRVPCRQDFINSMKTSGKFKTAFCKKWLEATERFIINKPKDLDFCKVVAIISAPDFWDSRLTIFLDENYYNGLIGGYAKEKIPGKSFVGERMIKTSLSEFGCIQEIIDEDYYYKGFLWFYGELLD